MGLFALIVYGVGDMLGAGIYALVGKWAGIMGNAVWLGFVVSWIAAVLTGLSYASLGSRYPKAAGAAYISQRAWAFPFLSYLVGLAVVASGLTSMGTQARAFTGYALGLFGFAPPGGNGADATILPEAAWPIWAAVVLGFIGLLTLINIRGIQESSRANFIFTLVEVLGLVLVIVVGLRFWGSVDYLETPTGTGGAIRPALVLQGAVLTFYSFIGFEDLINVTEEAKNPERDYPIALITALALTAVIYIAVTITAVSVVPYAILARSDQPLVDVVTAAVPGFPAPVFSFIALFAISNTALLNYIMGSRVVYGMARGGLMHPALGAVHAERRTPHRAILGIMAVVIILAFSGELAHLASATSILLLCVFIVVNGALIVLKRRPGEPKGRFEVPTIIPVLGIATNLVMLWHADRAAWRIAGILIAGIAVLYFAGKWRGWRNG